MEGWLPRAIELTRPLVTGVEVIAGVVYFGTIVLAILLWTKVLAFDLTLFYFYRKFLVLFQILWLKIELPFLYLTKATFDRYILIVALTVIYVYLAYRLIPLAERHRKRHP